MPRYFFSFRTPSKLAFDDWHVHQKDKIGYYKVNLNDINSTVVISDSKMKHGSIFLHYGLCFDIVIEKDNKEQGESKAAQIIESLVPLVSFSESCYIGHPELILSYKMEEGKTELEEFDGHIMNKTDLPTELSLRTLNISRLSVIFDKLLPLPQDLKRSIDLATRWFYKSLVTNDLKDRFINLWIALEPLDVHLKNAFGLLEEEICYPICRECNKEFNICPNPDCKRDFSYKKPASGISGLKKLEESFGLGTKISKIRDARGKIFHSGLIPTDLETYVNSSFELLQHAIYFLLKMDKNEVRNFLKTDMRDSTISPHLSLVGKFRITKPITIHDFDKQPFLSSTIISNFEIVNAKKLGQGMNIEKLEMFGVASDKQVDNDLQYEFKMDARDQEATGFASSKAIS